MANSTIDNMIAIRVLHMLVQPFNRTEAYKLGIIDTNGKNLIPTRNFNSSTQHDAYNYLTRFVFNLKRLLAKLPGGDNLFKNFVAAMLLIKENKDFSDQVNELKLSKIIDMLEQGVVFVEESLLAEKLIMEEFSGGVGVVAATPFSSVAGSLGSPVAMSGVGPVNKTGPEVSTDVQFPLEKKKILKRKKSIEGTKV